MVARLESIRVQAAFATYGLYEAIVVLGKTGSRGFFHSADEATQELAPDAQVIPAPATAQST
jgi:hypothetical protein